MTVKLQGTYSGEQVVEDFKRACSFQTGEKSYSVKDYDIEYQYEPGSVKQTVKRAGAILVQSFSEWQKKFWFFGPIIQKTKELYTAKLFHVSLVTIYSEVEIRALVPYLGEHPDAGIYGYFSPEPGDEHFNGLLIEKLIGNFYKELQSLSST